MKRRFLLAGALSIGLSFNTIQAQQVDPQCEAGTTQDLCQKAIDLFRYTGPQLGTLIAGGNATLGQGGTLGGFPHFRAGLRVNVMRVSLPEVDAHVPTDAGARSDEYPTDGRLVPMPQVDAALGILRGFPLGITNVGGLDLLLSMSYLPSFSQDDFELSGSTKIGVGVRVGILQESLLVPGLAFTYLRRDLPATAGFRGRMNDDSLTISDVSVKTRGWRLVASKNLLVFGVSAGMGKDRYSSNARFMGYVSSSDTELAPTSAGNVVTRNNMFLDLSANLPFLKIIGEIGKVSGGDNPTFNTFDKGPNSSRVYGSIGLRAGF